MITEIIDDDSGDKMAQIHLVFVAFLFD